MSNRPATNGTLTQWYRNRIGEPTTADEARGYWIFAAGVILGIVGMGLLVADDLTGPVPQGPVVIVAAGLALLIAGPIIRLPLRRVATVLVYVGIVLCAAAILWFTTAYPGWRPQATSIIGLYSLGLLAMVVASVFVPLLSPGPETDGEPTGAEADRDAHAAAIEAERDEARAAQADAEADEADLADRLRELRTSQARFELYEDNAGEHRWRLRHRNGNVIADSGEGYTQRHNAQNGMQSVRRNALGATTLLIESEEELPEETEEFEPVEEAPSQATFELYEDNAGEHRWRLRHDNGNILADSGQGYASAGGARSMMDNVRGYVGPADYLRFDPTGFEVYRDEADEYRWRLVHRNGNILADSGEGYSRRHDARRAVDRIRERVDEFAFEVYEDSAGEYRWRLQSSNDRIVADSGEGYADRGGAEDAVERIREYAPEADTLDIGRAAFEVYEDNAGEHRWRLRHRNGNILADSGQGYADRSGAYDGVESVKRHAPNAETEA